MNISYRSSPAYNGYTFFSSILLFLWAKHYSFKNNILYRFIVRLTPYTFGVYLIHDNPYIRTLLWEHWLTPSKYIDAWFLLPVMLLSVILIYLTCTFGDYLRARLFLFLNLNEKICFALKKFEIK